MKFLENRFLEVVEILESIALAPSHNDKRRSDRALISLPIGVLPVEGTSKGVWSQAVLHDLSPRGVSVEITHGMEIGSSFFVRFPVRKGKSAGDPMICRVIYCNPQKSGTFFVGAEFAGKLKPAERAAVSFSEQERIRQSILG